MTQHHRPQVFGGQSADDRTLIRFVRAGDEHSCEELYRRYAGRLHGIVSARSPKEFACRFDADDVVQSVFRVFFEGIRSKFYDVPMDEEIWGLLAALAVNKLRDKLAHHRAAKRSVYLTAADSELAISGCAARDTDAASALKLMVEEYLAMLPPSDREVVALRMTGHAIAEIVVKTGGNLRAVERILKESRDRLKQLLSA